MGRGAWRRPWQPVNREGAYFTASGVGALINNGAPNAEEVFVSDATYKVTEVVGTSTESIQKAVRNGISRAG